MQNKLQLDHGDVDEMRREITATMQKEQQLQGAYKSAMKKFNELEGKHNKLDKCAKQNLTELTAAI